MLTLRRGIRHRETMLLPDGKQIKIDLDVSTNQRQLLRLWNETTLAARDWAADEGSDARREAFYAKFGEFLRLILGAKNYAAAVNAYDGHVDELCATLDGWVAEAITPRIVEASKAAMTRRVAMVRRAEKAAK